MDTTEALLRAFAFRLALLVIAVFIARTAGDTHSFSAPGIQIAASSQTTPRSRPDAEIKQILSEMSMHD